MKTEKLTRALYAVLILLSFCSCRKASDDCGKDKISNRVFIIYSCGHNNLSSMLLDDIREVGESITHEMCRESDRIIVFNHASVGRNYSAPVNPVLMQMYRNKKGVLVKDTLKVFQSKTYASDGTPSEEGYTGSDPKTLVEVLQYVKKNFPSKQYSLLMSSHGTGWLPYNYYSTGVITKTFGADYSGSGSMGVPYEIDVKDLAQAFRTADMKFEYILMDACYMGGVETAYELGDVCRYFLASQTEIWGDGLVYTSILNNIFARDPEKGLTAICEEYMEYYRKMGSPATISLVDCSGMALLARVCRELFEKYRSEMNSTYVKETAQVFRPTTTTSGWYNKTFFYDLEDVLLASGIDGDEQAALSSALGACVLFKDATDKLFDGSALKHHCGLTMFLPVAAKAELSGYYRGFMWNKDTALVK